MFEGTDTLWCPPMWRCVQVAFHPSVPAEPPPPTLVTNVPHTICGATALFSMQSYNFGLSF